jgi:hypothetical protein
MYSSNFSSTWALDGGEWSMPRPGRSLPPGKTRYPLYGRLSEPQGRSGQVRKISPTPGFDPWTVRKVAGSTPDGVIGIFHLRNPFGRTMALGLTQPVTDMSTRNIS